MTLTDTRRSILLRLAPLRDVGLLIRGLPNAPARQGVEVKDLGILALQWTNDVVTAPQSPSRSTQEITINWLLKGQLSNLQGEDGAEAVRDALYTLTIGFRPQGCGPLHAISMAFPTRSEQRWELEYRFACTAQFCGVFSEPNDVGDVVTANLLQVFYDPVEIRDRWGQTVSVTSLSPPPEF